MSKPFRLTEKMSIHKRAKIFFEKYDLKITTHPPFPSYPIWTKSQQNIFLTKMASQRSGEEYPRPVYDKVAGVATPHQGQYSLSHHFHWKHFLKDIIVLKNKDKARTCVAMSRWQLTEPGNTERKWLTPSQTCSTGPHLTRIKKLLNLSMKWTRRQTQSQ